MKADVLNIKGEKIREIELPECFSFPLRRDILSRLYEASKKKQPYAPFILAGLQASASGKIKHARRKWKTVYGYGMSRVPRKIFSRSGNRFSWRGATVASTRGGREAHPPKVESMIKEKKINKKERLSALFSAISSISPLIVDSLSNAKTKEIISFVNKLKKNQKGKLLIVTAKNENTKTKIFDVAKASQLSVKHLYPYDNRYKIVIYTEQAINELRNLK
jgi:large subunit ribosomal protein L4e